LKDLQRRNIQLNILVRSQVETIVNIGTGFTHNPKRSTPLHVQLGTRGPTHL
jgi:hypothetical protein